MFDTNTPADQSGQPQQQPVTFKVGDREYDIAAATTKIEHSEKHIGTLEQELKALREQLSLTESQKKALEALSHNSPAQPPAPTGQAPAFDVDDLLAKAEQRVYESLSRKQQEAQAATNLAACTEAAKAVFGDAYQQELLKRGSELGMSKDDIAEFAKTKPEAFKGLFGLRSEQTRPTPNFSSSFNRRPTDQDTPVQAAARAIRDTKASGRDRTSAVANALKGLL